MERRHNGGCEKGGVVKICTIMEHFNLLLPTVIVDNSLCPGGNYYAQVTGRSLSEHPFVDGLFK